MTGHDFTYILFVSVTLIIGLLGWFAGKRTTFVNAVTSKRAEWIFNLRIDISKFCGNTLHYALRIDDDPKILEKIRDENDELRYKIKLYLNRKEPEHERVIELIDRIPKLTDNGDIDKIKSGLNDLTEASQDILKNAWDNIVEEAQKGKPVKS